MKPHLRAELLSEIAHFWTAQQNIEWSAGSAPLAGDEMLHHFLLFWSHLVILQRLEPIAYKLHIARIGCGRLRHQKCHRRRNQTNNDDQHVALHNASLEVELPCELNDSRAARLSCRANRGKSAETNQVSRTGGIQESARRTELSGSVQCRPVRMVEHVVG